ncbi:MAG: DUF3822 family protein [Bacteroidales bacterium]|nr:DUF3822 family protein [Bacteroidales bacterium]
MVPFTLVPSHFFSPEGARAALEAVSPVNDGDEVRHAPVAQYGAQLVYATAPGGPDGPPEIFDILGELPLCPDYNKLLCSWRGGILSMAIAQGRSLLLANSYDAPDFTTAQYFIFLAMKSLQLNPEVTVIRFRHPLAPADETALYRYFKSVETAAPAK